MRRIIFWLMVAVVLFLVIILGVAAKKQVSPKALMKSRFTTSTSVATPTTTGDDSQQALHDAIEAKLKEKETVTGEDEAITTGELSAEDQAQVEDFMNSIIQTP